jgi:hypothetical protein
VSPSAAPSSTHLGYCYCIVVEDTFEGEREPALCVGALLKGSNQRDTINAWRVQIELEGLRSAICDEQQAAAACSRTPPRFQVR